MKIAIGAFFGENGLHSCLLDVVPDKPVESTQAIEGQHFMLVRLRKVASKLNKNPDQVEILSMIRV